MWISLTAHTKTDKRVCQRCCQIWQLEKEMVVRALKFVRILRDGADNGMIRSDEHEVALRALREVVAWRIVRKTLFLGKGQILTRHVLKIRYSIIYKSFCALLS